jgi:hypothetical protein
MLSDAMPFRIQEKVDKIISRNIKMLMPSPIANSMMVILAGERRIIDIAGWRSANVVGE